MNQAKLDLSTNSLGKLIKIIWREKVEYRNNTSHYVNLKITVEYPEKRQINGLEELKEIQFLCCERGWCLDRSQIDKKIVTVMKLCDSSRDQIVMNGERLAFRITVNMESQMNINMRSYGHPMTLFDIKGKHAKQTLFDVIQEAMFLCEFARPCIGQEIPNHESSPYKTHVNDSNIISVISSEREQHAQLVSSSCLLIKTLR